MARKATGSVYESRGTWYVSLSIAPKKRKSQAMPTCTTETEATERGAILASAVHRLRKAGRSDLIDPMLEQLAAAAGDRLAAALRVLEGVLDGLEERDAIPVAAGETFKTLAEKWLSGDLHRAYPDHVRPVDHDKNCNRARLSSYVLPYVVDLPIKAFTLDHAEEIMRRPMPKRSRRHIAQLIVRICRLAVYPAKLITHSPIPFGWLPKALKPRLGLYLYPEEDAALLACAAVPLERRMLEGFLDREGTRASEAALIEWVDIDLRRGVLRLEENKTDDPRAWALSPGVATALRAWRKMRTEGSYVFGDGIVPPNVRHLASQLRGDLKPAGIDRAVLFEATEKRMRLRAHDLRATFITLSLANGKTEQWVSDRTGHKSSVMIQRYRRAARQAEELGLGELLPLSEAIPELSAIVASDPSLDGGKSGAMQTTAKQGVRRAGLEPASLSAPEPKTASTKAIEAHRGDLSSDRDLGSPPIPSDADTADAMPTFRRLAATPLGRASLKAIEAAKSGDPEAIAAAVEQVAEEHAAARDGELEGGAS